MDGMGRLTTMLRGVARWWFYRLGGEAARESSPVFRGLSWTWRWCRQTFHRLARRQPALLVVLDQPQPVLAGFGAITGWAVCRAGRVVHVEARVGGRVIAAARPTEAREDVRQRFPHYRGRGPLGFRLTPPPELLRDGPQALTITAWSDRGRSFQLATVLTVRGYRVMDDPTLPTHLQGSNREYQLWRRRGPTWAVPRAIGSDGPRISVVMPVHRTPRHLLREAFDSVRGQTYPNWELCVGDDGSRQPELAELLEEYARSDGRIRVTSLPSNRGISAATHAAARLATGGAIALMDHDDVLAPTALAAVAAPLAAGADLVYTDEDRIDPLGYHVAPFFKPAWSPDLVRGMMYLAHLCVYRRELWDHVGGPRSAFDGAQDWDLALRATEQARSIVHVPGIHYHWRMGGNSATTHFNRVCHEHGRRAIAEALRRCGESGRVLDGPGPCTFHVRYDLPMSPPRVAILIPTRDRVGLLRTCLTSLRRHTAYPQVEIIVIDNGSTTAAMRRYLRRSPADRVLRVDEPFNHSRLCNLGVAATTADLVLLLNDDTQVRQADWLTAMVEQACRAKVGAVGANLRYPDGRFQHRGIVLGAGAGALPLNDHLTRDGLDRGSVRYIRNVSAVTGACLLMRRAVYQEIGGMDETGFPTSFNDVDLCLRLRRAGYWIVQTPLAELVHHETASRVVDAAAEEVYLTRLRDRWGDAIDHDPFWNRYLTRGRPAEAGLCYQWAA